MGKVNCTITADMGSGKFEEQSYGVCNCASVGCVTLAQVQKTKSLCALHGRHWTWLDHIVGGSGQTYCVLYAAGTGCG
jgi:hypothetical protein